MIYVATGLPGAGKSTKLAGIAVDLFYHNRKAHSKFGTPLRKVYSNLKFTPQVEEEFKEEFGGYWTSLLELVKLRDCDILIDEVPVYMDSRAWENMPIAVRQWLAQHRKYGIDIFCTAQDFAQCDKSFRRLVSDLEYLKKIAGSRDISSTRPPPKFVWGVVFVTTLDPTKYDELKSKFASTNSMPSLMWIDKSSTLVFDTRAEVRASSLPPLQHTERTCELPNCSYHKVVHS